MPRTKVYHKRGGAELIVASGGKVTIESGGELAAALGSTITGLDGAATFASEGEAQAGVVNNKNISPATLAAVTGTTTRAGLLELATDAETQTGSDTARAITPANLQACTATASRKGVVELATEAEALAGTDTARAVTPKGLVDTIANVELIAFAGHNGAGACTATGLKVNDVILSVTGVVAADVGDQSANFETVVTIADQIQQTAAGNLNTKVYMALVLRKS